VNRKLVPSALFLWFVTGGGALAQNLIMNSAETINVSTEKMPKPANSRRDRPWVSHS
jgi:hypothetical protein